MMLNGKWWSVEIVFGRLQFPRMCLRDAFKSGCLFLSLEYRAKSRDFPHEIENPPSVNGITLFPVFQVYQNRRVQKNNRENLILDSSVIIESMLRKDFIREGFKVLRFRHFLSFIASNQILRFFFNFNPEASTRIIGL